MTKQEFAKKLAQEVSRSPCSASVSDIVNRLLAVNINGRKASSADIQEILGYMEQYLQNWHVIHEQFDNEAALNFMQMVHAAVAQAKTNNRS